VSVIEADIIGRCVVELVTGAHGDDCSRTCRAARAAVDAWLGAIIDQRGAEVVAELRVGPMSTPSDPGAEPGDLAPLNGWRPPPPTDCPVCDAHPGADHADGCTIERCPCGGQRTACNKCPWQPRRPWIGWYPGTLEAAERDWFKFERGGKRPDLNKALEAAMGLRWDPLRAGGRLVARRYLPARQGGGHAED